MTDGKAAYKNALQQVPDLILMDVKIPGWDGFETCRAFKSNTALTNIPVIFVTGRLMILKRLLRLEGSTMEVSTM